MTTSEINALLALRKRTIKSIADAISKKGSRVSRTQVSQTINYERENAHLRPLIAAHLGMPERELFEPWARPASSQQSAPAAARS